MPTVKQLQERFHREQREARIRAGEDVSSELRYEHRASRQEKDQARRSLRRRCAYLFKDKK